MRRRRKPGRRRRTPNIQIAFLITSRRPIWINFCTEVLLVILLKLAGGFLEKWSRREMGAKLKKLKIGRSGPI